MANVIIVAIILFAVGSAIYYIWKEKKKGRHCIGCPMAGSCSSCKGSGCGGESRK